MKNIIIGALFALISSAAFANEIYIQQIGDTLNLSVTQAGTGNKLGTSTSVPAVFNGDDMTFTITQTGDNNTIDATINGNTYTGTWSFVGNGNTVDLLCDSADAVQCETVTLDIAVNGDTNDFTVYIGENKVADNLVADFTVDGDGNVIVANLDATNADVTVIIDNSASLAGGNTFTIDQDDAGGVNGHSITYDHTGGGGTISITQSGLNDQTVNVTSSGDDHNVTIVQTD
jgi:hypothetical protein